MGTFKIILKDSVSQEDVYTYYSDVLPGRHDMIGLLSGEDVFVITKRLLHPAHGVLICYGYESIISREIEK